MIERKRKAAGYLRRSTDRQEQSIEDQRRTILAFGGARGFELDKFFVDDAISGTVTDDRKAFQQMIHEAREPGCPWRYVLVYDVKRFGRIDNDEAGYYRFLLRQAGVEVIYVTENFNGDDSDDLVRPVKQWQARQESKDLSKVTIRGQVSLSGDGWWLGGAPPFGFDLVYYDSTAKPYMVVRFMDDGTKEILDSHGQRQRTLPRGESIAVSKKDHARLAPSTPERVALVGRIFKMYLAGLGYKTIANRLNGEAVPSPRNGEWAPIHDGRWSSSTIRQILCNVTYVGDLAWNRRTLAKFHRIANGQAVLRTPYSRNRTETNPKDDWIVFPNAHDPLVDREVFEGAQRLRESRDQRTRGTGFRRGRGKNSPFLLSGILKCGRCGHTYQGHTVTSTKRRKDGERFRTLYYLCGGYMNKGTSVCQKMLFRQDRFDERVVAEVGRRIMGYLAEGGMDLLRRCVEESLSRPTGDDPSREIPEIRGKLAEIEKKADSLLEMMTPANREFVDEKLVRLRQEREALKARLRELEAVSAPAEQANGLASEVLSTLREFEGVFKKGAPEERKALIRAFVPEILLEPDGGQAIMRIRRFPPPRSRAGGNLSFRFIAGGGFEPPTSGL